MSTRDNDFDQPFDISKLPSQQQAALSGVSNETTANGPAVANPAGNVTSSSIVWRGGTIDYVGLTRRYALWIVCGVISGLMLGHVLYLKFGPEYTATSRILVSRRAASPTSNHQPVETFGERGEHIALIMSPLIVEQAVAKHQLNELGSLRKSKDIVEDLLDELTVKRSAGTDRSMLNVLDVTMKNSSRDDVRTINDAIIDAYHDYLIADRDENVSELKQFVAQNTSDLLQKIEGKEAEYERFRQTAPIHLKAPVRGPKGERVSVATNVHQEKLEALEKEQQLLLVQKAEIQGNIQAVERQIASGRSREELATMIQLFSALQVRSGSAASGSGAGGVLGGGSNSQSSLDGQLLPLMLKEQQLLQEYGADWPEVRATRQQIATLKGYYRQRGIPIPGESQLVDPATGLPALPGSGGVAESQSLAKTVNGLDVVDVYLASLRQQLDAAGLREKEIERLYRDEFEKARTLSKFLDEDRRFNDDLDRLHGLWNALQVDAAKLDLQKENLGYSLKVIAPAKVELSLKRIAKLYGAGLVAVMGLLSTLIFVREWSDTSLKSVDEIRESIPLPILGTVPAYNANARGIPGSPLQPALCYFHRPGSPEAEAYRSVRTAFSVSVPDGHNVIQVTSPEPGDGKSTLIANLAIAMAQSGRQVLLIDCDLRRPTLHTLFGLRRSIGVTDVLAGEIDLLTAAQHTAADGLSILTCGDAPPNPAELLASRQFSRMLHEAEQEFDLVLIDTPPLLAVSDPCIVAQHTDGLILVLRMSKNKRNTAKRSTEILMTNNIRVVGLVCNGTDAESEGYSYRDTYGEYLSSEEPPPPRRSMRSPKPQRPEPSIDAAVNEEATTPAATTETTATA
ncbi:polysaccharide biosynthesis tyrosine autokinase [bacterium]|nr:polysaccharide biosynthesis tyrosine autokinase [bacterium]